MHNFNVNKFKHYIANKHSTKHKSQTFNLQEQKQKFQPLRARTKTFKL